MKFCRAAVLLVLGSVALLSLPSRLDALNPQMSLEHAISVMDLREAGRSFILRARYRILTGQRWEADYVLHWDGSRSREAVTAGANMVVRITDSNGNAWTAGAADSRTVEVLRAMRVLDSRSSLWPEPNIKVEGEKKRSGLVCGRARADRDREFCFDPSTGILVHDRFGKITREYTSYEAFGSKLYPRLFRTFADSRLRAEIVVTELLAPSALDASLFSPLAHAERSRWCRRFDPAYPARTSLPPQPAIAITTSGEERATLTAEVSGSGAVQLVNVNASLPKLRRYAIDAVQRWQFQPAVCDGRNVEGEVRIEIRMRCGHPGPRESWLNCETSSRWFLQSE